MRIAVMTWFDQDQYGTVLQAAALCRVLSRMGHEPQIVNYRHKDRIYTVPDDSLSRQMSAQVRRRTREMRNPYVIGEVSGEPFRQFRDSYMPRTRCCRTQSDLEALNHEFDAFICGSDRIWLPTAFDPHFMLDYVRDPQKMIAYAPSILEFDKADRYVSERMKSLIGRFTHLSVREDTGRRLMADQMGEEPPEVADPTLLLSVHEWEEWMKEDLSSNGSLLPPPLLSKTMEERTTLMLTLSGGEPAVDHVMVDAVAAAVKDYRMSTKAAAAEAAEAVEEEELAEAAEAVEEEELAEAAEAVEEAEKAEGTKAAEETEATEEAKTAERSEEAEEAEEAQNAKVTETAVKAASDDGTETTEEADASDAETWEDRAPAWLVDRREDVRSAVNGLKRRISEMRRSGEQTAAGGSNAEA